MLDVEKLATLRMVVACGSFSAAAHQLNLTQPAVSRQVSLLERRLGTRLVHRSRRGVVPTEAGQLLLGHAEAVLDRLSLAEAQIGQLAGTTSGTVRLGSFFTALVYLSAEVGAVLAEHHPGLIVVDDLVDRAEATTKLMRGELEVALVFDHDFEPAGTPDGLTVLPLFDDPVRVLLPATHPLARRRRIRPAELAGDTWIRAHDGSAARRIDDLCRRHGLAPHLLLAGHGDEPVEAQALVAAGRGVTLAHQLNVIIDPDHITVRPLNGYHGLRHIQAAYIPDRPSPAVRATLDALHQVGQRHTR